jgi:hypothetical protein
MVKHLKEIEPLRATSGACVIPEESFLTDSSIIKRRRRPDDVENLIKS